MRFTVVSLLLLSTGFIQHLSNIIWILDPKEKCLQHQPYHGNHRMSTQRFCRYDIDVKPVILAEFAPNPVYPQCLCLLKSIWINYHQEFVFTKCVSLSSNSNSKVAQSLTKVIVHRKTWITDWAWQYNMLNPLEIKE